MGSRRRFYPLRLKVSKDCIEMQGGSVKDMEALTMLSERVQKPHETCVGTSGIRTTGYGEQGESNALLWGAGVLAQLE